MKKMDLVWLVGLMFLLVVVPFSSAYSTYCIVLSNNTICFNDSGITGVSNITATNINASDVLNAPWLVASDQRYNNTALVSSEAVSRVGNDSYILGLLASNSSSLVLEIQNRIGNDTFVSTQINNNVSVVNSKISSLGNWSNDKSLYTLLSVTQNINSSIVGNSSSLVLEIQNRIGNDTSLQNQIILLSAYNDTNLSNRITTINNSLTSEISARTSLGNWSADKSSYALDSRVTTVNNSLSNYYLLSNPYSYYNSSTLPPSGVNMTTVVNGVGNWSADKSSYYLASNPNNYLNTTTIGDFATNTRVTTVNSTVNSIGNWSADKSSYALDSRVTTVNSTANSLGNWSADKSSYALDSRVTTVNNSLSNYYLGSNPNNYLNTTTIGDFATNTRVTIVNSTANSIGNWSADKSSYNTTAQNDVVYATKTSLSSVNTTAQNAQSAISSIGNWTNDKSNYALDSRVTTVNNSLSTKANLNGGNIFTGITYINTTLNIMDGVGNNGTTISGNTIWTQNLYAAFIGAANISNPMNINGSNNPAITNTFTNGNSSNLWSQMWATNIYGNINASYIQNSPWSLDSRVTTVNNSLSNYYLLSNPNNYYNSTTLTGVVTGTGNTNTITKWSNSTNIINSSITDDGQNLTIGSGTTAFEVNSSGTYSNRVYFENGVTINSRYNSSARIDSLNTTVVNLQTSVTGNATSLTNEISALTSVGNYTANGMPKAGGTFTGNVTMASGVCLVYASGGSICE